MRETKEIYSIKDLSLILGRTERAIRIALSRNQKTIPPSLKLGGRRVFVKRTVDKWLDEISGKSVINASIIIFLLLVSFAPVMGWAATIQPPTQEEWKAAKTCGQAVALATRQATIDMADLKLAIPKSELQMIMLRTLKKLPNSPCFQDSKTSKSDKRGSN